MKAAVLNAVGEPLAVQTLPDPVLGTGEVIVDVAAAGVTNYARDVFSGARNYMLELPMAPASSSLSPPNRSRPASGSATPSAS